MKITISNWLCEEFRDRELSDAPYNRCPAHGPYVLEALPAELNELKNEAEFQLECNDCLETYERRGYQVLARACCKALGVTYKLTKKGC